MHHGLIIISRILRVMLRVNVALYTHPGYMNSIRLISEHVSYSIKLSDLSTEKK